MPTLKPLTTKKVEALGKTKKFTERYQTLLALSENQSIRDNALASLYVDDVINRYILIEATQPQQKEIQIKKNDYLLQLRQHVAEMSVVSFSKPGDIITRLQAVHIPEDAIDKIVKGMEQAGNNDDDGFYRIIITSQAVNLSILSHVCLS
jgi:hypothetical protein